MKKFFRMTAILLVLSTSFILVPGALAHPLGNFTINQYVGLQIGREAMHLDYVLDMAEIPAFQEIAALDANGDGLANSSEAAGYHPAACAALSSDFDLKLNGRPVALSLSSSSVDFPAGVGGLPTIRLTCEFQAPIEFGADAAAVAFENHAYPDRLGWREIVVLSEEVDLQGTYSSTSPSQRLTAYPDDLLSSPIDQRRVEFEIAPLVIPQKSESTASAAAGSSAADRNDAFTRLILMQDITFSTILVALVISFIWGAMHAMTPGHGKTIVGAYLVGSRGTIKHALYLGLTTTITHTLGVFALGLITLFAAQYIVPDSLFPWISLLSGLFVVGIGISLLGARVRALLPGRTPAARKPGRFEELSAISIEPRARLITAPISSHDAGYVLNTSPSGLRSHAHVHRHADGSVHSHEPPGADGSPVTWRSLLTLGISGGLLPCPSALVVLLGAIALDRIGLGLVLVLAFSLGLAGALTAIGMLFIYAGRLFDRFPARGRAIGLLPMFSALFISVVGLGIILRALADVGILQ